MHRRWQETKRARALHNYFLTLFDSCLTHTFFFSRSSFETKPPKDTHLSFRVTGGHRWGCLLRREFIAPKRTNLKIRSSLSIFFLCTILYRACERPAMVDALANNEKQTFEAKVSTRERDDATKSEGFFLTTRTPMDIPRTIWKVFKNTGFLRWGAWRMRLPVPL